MAVCLGPLGFSVEDADEGQDRSVDDWLRADEPVASIPPELGCRACLSAHPEGAVYEACRRGVREKKPVLCEFMLVGEVESDRCHYPEVCNTVYDIPMAGPVLVSQDGSPAYVGWDVMSVLFVDFVKDHGEASAKELAEHLCHNVRSVHNYARRLVEEGVVVVERAKGRGAAHMYRLNRPN